MKRKQLTQIEVVRAHKRAINETSLTVQDLAKQLGMDRSTVANNLRVLELPDLVLEHVENGALGLTVAREFLVLQNSDPAHTEDMRWVVKTISQTWGRSGAPDWSRRHVRELVYQRVACNETDFRPLGPRPKHYEASAAREATFDVETFAAEWTGTLHTIPANEGYGGKYELSRVWTCDVKAWRGWQTRATREANVEAVAAGGQPSDNTASSKRTARIQQLEELLAQDPVWKKISVSRETPGPGRPVTDEEREQLGTRAELQEVRWGTPFWKVLQRDRPAAVHRWDKNNSGPVRSWFPNLKECQQCTIGAAYGVSDYGYPLEKPTLCCFNQAHYQEKLQAGEADYKAKLDAQEKGVYRQDRETIQELIRQLQPLSDAARTAFVTSLLAATPELELQHPLGAYHEAFSYESGAAARVRELLGIEGSYRNSAALKTLPDVALGDLRELAAALVAHHLRIAGKLETVSRETPASAAGNNGHR